MNITLHRVNKSLSKPLLILGVEKKLVYANALMSFPLVGASHFRFPGFFIGIAVFLFCHCLLRLVSQSDPLLGQLFQRSTRYTQQWYYPPVSHPYVRHSRSVLSLSSKV